jgi:hypothetical protein
MVKRKRTKGQTMIFKIVIVPDTCIFQNMSVSRLMGYQSSHQIFWTPTTIYR